MTGIFWAFTGIAVAVILGRRTVKDVLFLFCLCRSRSAIPAPLGPPPVAKGGAD